MSATEAAGSGPSLTDWPSGKKEGKSLALHPRLLRVTGGIALALSVLGGVWWFAFRPYVSTDDARIAAPMVVVTPEGAGGRVERVMVREGQQVKAGTPLIELDATAERAMVERARASLALAEARVGEAETQVELERQLTKAVEQRARAGLRSAEATHQRTVRGARAEEIAKARADSAAAEATAQQAARDLNRSQTLWADAALSAASLEAARSAEASARAALEARRAALELLEHGNRAEDISISQGGILQAQAGLTEAGAGPDRVAYRTKQLDAARAQAAQARADLTLAEIARNRMTLISTVSGTVVRVTVDPGDHLAAGQGAVTLVDLDSAWIAANVEETSAGLLRPGQAVSISIDEGGELSGHVDVITQAAASQFALIPADNAAGNFTKVVQRIPIRIAIDPSAQVKGLQVGQSVEVRIRVR